MFPARSILRASLQLGRARWQCQLEHELSRCGIVHGRMLNVQCNHWGSSRRPSNNEGKSRRCQRLDLAPQTAEHPCCAASHSRLSQKIEQGRRPDGSPFHQTEIWLSAARACRSVASHASTCSSSKASVSRHWVMTSGRLSLRPSCFHDATNR